MENKNGAYHHGNLKRALIDAALALITEKGVTAFTIREVARQAGVSHTAPYRHFSDKTALLENVAMQGFGLLVNEMHQRMAAYPDDPLQRFKACGLAYIDFAIHHPSHYRVMFGPEQVENRESETIQKSASACSDTLLGCITDCQAVGLIRQGDPQTMALAAWSMAHGFSMLYIDHHVQPTAAGQGDLESLMEMATDTLYFGLAPTSEAPKG